MLTEYIHAALKRGEYKKLEDQSWFAEIPGFEGVWANGGTIEECRAHDIGLAGLDKPGHDKVLAA